MALLEKLNLYLFVERNRKEDVMPRWFDSSIVVEEKNCNAKVKMCTPHLKSVSLTTLWDNNHFPVEYLVEDELSSLVSAHISVSTGAYVDHEFSQSLIKIMHSVYNVRELLLWVSSEQVLPGFPILLEELAHQFQNLRSIKLGNEMKLPDGDVNGKLDLSFTVEALDINSCCVSHLKILQVSAPLLEKLRLCLFVERNQDDMWWTDSVINQEEKPCNVKVKFCASQLKSLTLATYSSDRHFPVDYFTEDELLSLDSANIHICTDEYIDDESSQSLIKVLQCVHNVRALELSISTKKVLTDFPILLEELPHQFQNLRCIKLGDLMKFPCIHAIANFLLSFPCIETLVWERDWEQWSGVTNEAEESVASQLHAMKSNLQFQKMFDCLKTVEFRGVTGIEIGSEFLAFILERVILLEKIIIKVHQALSGTKLGNFKKTCLCLPRASPNASISFYNNKPFRM